MFLVPHLLCLRCSDLLPNLFRVVHYHRRALLSHGRDKVVATTCLEKLAGGIVAPAMYIVVQRPDTLPDLHDGR